MSIEDLTLSTEFKEYTRQLYRPPKALTLASVCLIMGWKEDAIELIGEDDVYYIWKNGFVVEPFGQTAGTKEFFQLLAERGFGPNGFDSYGYQPTPFLVKGKGFDKIYSQFMSRNKISVEKIVDIVEKKYKDMQRIDGREQYFTVSLPTFFTEHLPNYV